MSSVLLLGLLFEEVFSRHYQDMIILKKDVVGLNNATISEPQDILFVLCKLFSFCLWWFTNAKLIKNISFIQQEVTGLVNSFWPA
jgi:hypothetical protein